MALRRTAGCTIAAIVFLFSQANAGVRLKDITDLQGARPNQLYGLGLVIGLQGTGSKSLFTQQLAVDVLQKLSIGAKTVSDVKNDNVFLSQNIAVVMVTTEIGAFARQGSRIDVTVSVYDDSRSLQGGVLLLTPLRGVDGQVYAVAQGSVSLGGFAFSGGAASAQKNHPTVGRIPAGAIVEKEAPGEYLCNGMLRLLLRDADFTTATAVALAVNDRFPASAITLDAGTIEIRVPATWRTDAVGFVSELGQLEVTPDIPARVIINERTGTVVAGADVKIATVAIAQGNLAISTVEEPQVSQPAPFSNGKTKVVPRTKLGVAEQMGAVQVMPRAVTVTELAQALNALGATPRDLIVIFQLLKQAGALHAELIIS